MGERTRKDHKKEKEKKLSFASVPPAWSRFLSRRDLLRVDAEKVRDELPQVEEHLARFGDRLPSELRAHLDRLKETLG